MKKILIATNILLLGIIAFLACNPGHQNKSAISVSTQPTYCNDSCMRKFCKVYNVENLPGRVNGVILNRMSQDYADDPAKSFIQTPCDKKEGGPNTAKTTGLRRDALSVVFSLDQLKNLIYQMELATCIDNCPPSPLGIRFYFVKYPCDLGSSRNKGDGLDDLPGELRGMHSLVMVPAYKKKIDSKWWWTDYALWESSRQNCFPIFRVGGTDDLVFAQGSLPDPGDNHGGIGPPPEPGIFGKDE